MKAKRVQVVALKRNREQIMQHLLSNGFKQLKSEFVEGTNYDFSCNNSINEVSALLKRLERILTETYSKINKLSLTHIIAVMRRLSGRTVMSDSFKRVKGKLLVDVDMVESRLKVIEDRLEEIDQSRQERENLIDEITPYSHLNIPFSTIQDTKHVKMTLGLLPSNKIFDLTTESKKYPQCNIVLLMSELNYRKLGKRSAERSTMVAYIVGLRGYDELVEFAENLGMTHCELKLDEIPSEALNRLRKEIEELSIEEQARMEQLIDCFHAIKLYIKHLKKVQSEYIDTAGTIVTKQTFFVEGEYPIESEAKVIGGLYAISSDLEVIYKNA